MLEYLKLVATALLFGGFLIAPAFPADNVLLPRKAGPEKNESYPGVTVLYDAIRDASGHRLRIIATHPDDAPLVRRQLQAYFPEALFQAGESTLENVWDTCSGEEDLVVEFGLAREFMLPLASGKIDPFIGIVGALSELRSGEFGLFQVLFQGAHEPWSESITRSVTHADGKPFFEMR